MLLERAKLDTIKVLISQALINSYFRHGEFVSVNNILRESNETKKEIQNPQNAIEYTI